MTKRLLFALWGVMFVFCAGLGFLPEVSRWMTVLSVLFFAPPGVLLYRAKKERDNHTRLLIRNLAALSLGLTVLLLVATFLTALSSEAVGNVLHCLLTVVSAPMLCSGHWALSLFLWACLLVGSLKNKNALPFGEGGRA